MTQLIPCPACAGMNPDYQKICSHCRAELPETAKPRAMVGAGATETNRSFAHLRYVVSVLKWTTNIGFVGCLLVAGLRFQAKDDVAALSWALLAGATWITGMI